jgi:non-specific serine/threonine protein kinase
MAIQQSDVSTAAVQLKEGLALGRAAGDGLTVWNGLYWLSQLARGDRESEQAAALIEECLAVARDLSEPRSIGEALWLKGALAYHRGDLDQAVADFEEVLEQSASQIQPHLLARTHWFLSTIALRQQDPARATALLREPLLINQALGNWHGIGYVLENLAWAAAQMSQSRRAARLLGAAAVLFETLEATGTTRGDDVAPEELKVRVAPARAALGEAEWAAAYVAGRSLSMEAAIAEALGEVD